MAGFIQLLHDLSSGARHEVLDSRISDTYHEITEDIEFVNRSASTNASMWDTEDPEFDPDQLQFVGKEARLPMTCHASGEQDEDASYCGDQIYCMAIAVFNDDGDVTYEDVTAEVVQPIEDE